MACIFYNMRYVFFGSIKADENLSDFAFFEPLFVGVFCFVFPRMTSC